jgi:hypothetical protein
MAFTLRRLADRTEALEIVVRQQAAEIERLKRVIDEAMEKHVL